jgi:hypothetical protein
MIKTKEASYNTSVSHFWPPTSQVSDGSQPCHLQTAAFDPAVLNCLMTTALQGLQHEGRAAVSQGWKPDVSHSNISGAESEN